VDIKKYSPTDRIVDEYLVLRCQEGDRLSLSLLIRKWQPAFLRFAKIVTKDNDLAADVVQDAWIKIIKGMPQLRDPVSFEAWAYRIVNNSCMDLIRKRKRRWKQQTDEVLDEETKMSSIDTFIVQDQVQALLGQLSDKHRSVLALHYLQGFEVKDIARITNTPRGTVKSQLFNAREKFRHLLEEQPEEKLDKNKTDISKGDKHEQSGPTDSERLAGSF
jgi:RNA polymerase sigma factor (sigma-70 family)